MDKLFLTNTACNRLAGQLYDAAVDIVHGSAFSVYGVPRGGIPVAYLVAARHSHSRIVDTPEEAQVIVDDLVDSGRTKARYLQRYPDKPFMTLMDFYRPNPDRWVVFPWENGEQDQSADDIVIRLLQYIGEDPGRGGLKETPQRVLKAWKEWTRGYGQEPQNVLKCFEDGASNYNEMVIVKDLPFYSHCEHHLAPFFGTATIAYLPDRKVVGLSKLSRVLDIYARRLQVQERLTSQVADALFNFLKPLGVGVLVKARHLCMESRGVANQGHHTVTSALRGKFFDEPQVRAEFLAIAQ